MPHYAACDRSNTRRCDQATVSAALIRARFRIRRVVRQMTGRTAIGHVAGEEEQRRLGPVPAIRRVEDADVEISFWRGA